MIDNTVWHIFYPISLQTLKYLGADYINKEPTIIL